mmetsp:Transcript_6718/g.15499  ORF Transcript_6718/g.15499 Transcript_6718/m.15499 type:complete len:285 (-) Transcript_6718:324-1178(-)
MFPRQRATAPEAPQPCLIVLGCQEALPGYLKIGATTADHPPSWDGWRQRLMLFGGPRTPLGPMFRTLTTVMAYPHGYHLAPTAAAGTTAAAAITRLAAMSHGTLVTTLTQGIRLRETLGSHTWVHHPAGTSTTPTQPRTWALSPPSTLLATAGRTWSDSRTKSFSQTPMTTTTPHYTMPAELVRARPATESSVPPLAAPPSRPLAPADHPTHQPRRRHLLSRGFRAPHPRTPGGPRTDTCQASLTAVNVTAGAGSGMGGRSRTHRGGPQCQMSSARLPASSGAM